MNKAFKLIIGVLAAAVATVALAVTCAADNSTMYATGSTKVVNGKLFYEYKCPQGHVTWVTQ